MKISGILGRNVYEFETTVKINKEWQEKFNIKETGFSPNPYNPVIFYEVERNNPEFQNLIDMILTAEGRK